MPFNYTLSYETKRAIEEQVRAQVAEAIRTLPLSVDVPRREPEGRQMIQDYASEVRDDIAREMMFDGKHQS